MCTTDVYRVRRIPEDEPRKARLILEEMGAGEESSGADVVSASAHLHEAVESLKKYRSMR